MIFFETIMLAIFSFALAHFLLRKPVRMSVALNEIPRAPTRYDVVENDIEIGDIVTRGGDDEQEVLDIDYGWGTLEVKCIKAPESGWCAVGDTETNLIRRYELVMKTVRGENYG